MLAKQGNTVTLRDYQVDCLAAIEDAIAKGARRLLVSLPTGAGKTIIFSELIRRLHSKKTLVLCPNLTLIDQSIAKIIDANPGVDVGRVDATTKDLHADVIVSTLQSARGDRFLDSINPSDLSLIVADEAHNYAAPANRQAVLTLSRAYATPVVGFTATPYRSDKLYGLGEVFDTVVFRRTVADLIDDGYLCPVIGHKIVVPEMDGNSISTDDTIPYLFAAWQKLAADRKTLVFAASIRHASKIAAHFADQGIAAEAISGFTAPHLRDAILERFRQGDTQVLANCAVLKEGFDEPTIACVFFARPVKSQNFYVQAAGRGLRLADGKKDCMLIDCSLSDNNLVGYEDLSKDRGTPDENGDTDEADEREAREAIAALPAKIVDLLAEFDPITGSISGGINAVKWRQADGCWIANLDDIEVVILEGGNIGRKAEYYTAYARSRYDDSGFVDLGRQLERNAAFRACKEYAYALPQRYYLLNPKSWDDKPATPKQIAFMAKLGADPKGAYVSKNQASIIIDGVLKKRATVPASAKQIWALRQRGFDVDETLTQAEAKKLFASSNH